jgi:hypothetical protein
MVDVAPVLRLKTPKHLSGRPVGEMHVEVALGPARPPRTPIKLVESRAEQQNRGETAENYVCRCVFDDWMVENSIGYDPLIYIEGGWSYPGRKYVQGKISKFPTSKPKIDLTRDRFGLGQTRPSRVSNPAKPPFMWLVGLPEPAYLADRWARHLRETRPSRLLRPGCRGLFSRAFFGSTAVRPVPRAKSTSSTG